MPNSKDNSPVSTRRDFVRGSLAVAAGAALAGSATEGFTESATKDTAAAETVRRKPVKHVLLFVHPPSTLCMNRLLKPYPVAEENWRAALAEKGSDEGNIACILRSHDPDKPLEEAALKHFGERCIINPMDNSDATRALLTRDLDRTFGGRGNHGEWNPYEIWTSNNARRWTEGLKKWLSEKGYACDPGSLTMETFGNWSGCHHKYSNFMGVYLGLKAPALIHAETKYCSLKSMPMRAEEFVELVPMDRHVWLAIFRREDGVPMAQYWDGLRPVWAPPHTASVTIEPGKVDVYNFSPNSLIPVNGVAKKHKDGVIADVGDGTHPAFTTIVGRTNGEKEFAELRAALVSAVIAPRDDRRNVSVAVET